LLLPTDLIELPVHVIELLVLGVQLVQGCALHLLGLLQDLLDTNSICSGRLM
jgi:hypothetical protein